MAPAWHEYCLNAALITNRHWRAKDSGLAAGEDGMVTMYSVNCMMCGRSSGQVRNGVFYRGTAAPPLENRSGRSRCGFCGGNLYLEPDDSIVAPLTPEEMLRRERRLAS